MKSFTDIATIEIIRIFTPLQRLNSIDSITALINELGYDFNNMSNLTSSFGELAKPAENLMGTVSLVIQSTDETQRSQQLGLAIEQLFSLIQQTNEIFDSKEFITRFFDYLFYIYLKSYHKQIFAVLHLLGIVEIVKDTTSKPIKTIQWERLPLLFSDQKMIVNKVYNWDNDQAFKGQEFLTRLEVLIRAFSLPGGLYTQSDELLEHFGRDATDKKELRIPLYQEGQWLPDEEASTYSELSLNVFPIPATVSDKPGLALYPYFLGNIAITEDISERWRFIQKGKLELDSGLGLQIRPPAKFKMDTGIFDTPAEEIDARLEFGIRRKNPDDELSYIFGSKDSSFLGFGETGFNLILALDSGKKEIAGEMLVNDLSLKIDLSDADGFLKTILAGIVIETTTDLVMGISSLDGFYFRGSGAPEIEIPLHKSLGPIDFESLYIRLIIADDMQVQFAVSMGFKLGPVSGSVEKIGIGIPVSISNDNSGNLGPIDVHPPVFVPPIGAGLALNLGGVIGGGGYLEFDDENKRYAGILSLKLGEIALVAIGLITTRMPDGSDGFSLLVNIGVTFSPPIQLSYGFTLNAVGGLVGVNRTMKVEALQAGLKNRTLDSILFPDPDTVIENAPKIISDLRTVFPPAVNRFVVGPMVKIGWGTPPIITGDVGIFIELPDPIQIVLLGQVEAVLPTKENAVVSLHMDILGVLSIQKSELTFQATLYDSKLLTYEMYGDAAMLVSWGNEPRFAMSIGGFHPKFTAPPPPIVFADLRRLSVNISASNNVRLLCAAYQAITPNTLQFGARVDCYMSFGGATVTGFLGYDTVFHFSPFSFVTDIGGGVTVKYKGYTLAEINLACTLSGTNPWNVKGKAKFKILWWSVKKNFNITWGDPEQRRLSSIDPWVALQDAVAMSGSWNSVLPSSSSTMATLRSLEDESSNIAVVHPSGKLEFRQNILPFDIALNKVANAPVVGHDKFEIEKITILNNEAEEEIFEISEIDEYFSRGQYQDLTDSEKLDLPSFEKMQAGASIENDLFEIFGKVEKSSLDYESILIDSDLVATPTTNKGFIHLNEYAQMHQSIIDKRNRQNATSNKFLHPDRRPMMSVNSEEEFYLANAVDLTSTNITENQGLSRIKIDEIMREKTRLSPTMAEDLVIVSLNELEKKGR